MRGILPSWGLCTMLWILARGADTAVAPRASSADYPVHGSAKATTIAAAIVPADRVGKMFSTGISKQYVVVEVAIYPEEGGALDVESSDFTLKVGRQVGHADRPLDVAPWPERHGPAVRLPVDVTVETGVIYDRSDDPVSGRRQGVGTYTGVAVTNGGPGQTDPAPPPDPGPDPRVVNERVRRKALPEGETRSVIAGYLYFPQYGKRRKSDAIELSYSKDDVSMNLVFPK